MFNIKKEIFIVALILLLIVLVFITFFYDKKEDVSVLTPRESASIVNPENLPDLEVGDDCDYKDYTQEEGNSERIKVFYDNNGEKEKEIVYRCVNKKKAKDQERFYRENGMLDRVVGYVDCADYLGCGYLVNAFTGIDGTRPMQSTSYQEGTKIYETFYHKEQLVKPKDLSPRNNAYKRVDYYEDGKTIYKETFYKPNVNNVGDITSVSNGWIEYYENGSKYREIGREQGHVYYHPDGRKRIAEKEVYRRDDGSTERIKEWFTNGGTEYIETFYSNTGNKTRKIIKDEGIGENNKGPGYRTTKYYEDILFRANGTVDKLTMKLVGFDNDEDVNYFNLFNEDGYVSHYKLVTYYDNKNILIKDEYYKNDILQTTTNHDLYIVIPDLRTIINQPNTTEQQKQNIIDNAGLFLSFCNYKSRGLVYGTKDIQRIGELGDFYVVLDKPFIGLVDKSLVHGLSEEDFVDYANKYNALRCDGFGFFAGYATIKDVVVQYRKFESSLLDKWERIDFYENDFAGYVDSNNNAYITDIGV